jgi:hypothetical protein
MRPNGVEGDDLYAFGRRLGGKHTFIGFWDSLLLVYVIRASARNGLWINIVRLVS